MTVGRVSKFIFSSGAKPKGKGPVKYAEGGGVKKSENSDDDRKYTNDKALLERLANDKALRDKLAQKRAEGLKQLHNTLTRSAVDRQLYANGGGEYNGFELVGPGSNEDIEFKRGGKVKKGKR